MLKNCYHYFIDSVSLSKKLFTMTQDSSLQEIKYTVDLLLVYSVLKLVAKCNHYDNIYFFYHFRPISKL